MSGRNQAARERRRNIVKEVYSVTSVPISEIGSVHAKRGINYDRLNLDNHFGWNTYRMARMGEGGYPCFAQFLEKPDTEGEFKQATYVLYIEKGGDVERVDKESAIKETQTGGSILNVQVKPEKTKKGKTRVIVPADEGAEEIAEEPVTEGEGSGEEHVEEKDKRKSKRKRKMISEFYYVPKDRSRSRKRGESAESNEGGDHEIVKITPDPSQTKLAEPEPIVEEDEEEKNKKDEGKGKRKGRKGPNKWQLRAGAEHVSDPNLLEKSNIKLVGQLDKISSEYNLFESNSGSNKYLYVSKERARSRQSSKSRD